MQRLKYIPSGFVIINNVYKVPYAVFSQHCTQFGLVNPFIEGSFGEYTPQGFQSINIKGNHSTNDPADEYKNIYATFNANSARFVNAITPPPPEPVELTRREKIARDFIREFSLYDLIEALIDATDGNLGRINQIKTRRNLISARYPE